jgi:hypothetical protein
VEPASQHSFAVVELFTSEGCHSCPPADDVLAEVLESARNTGLPVYALAWHVNYWDYLGWEDPYGLEIAAERQRWYAGRFDGRVYTPQIIVNGTQVAGYAGDQRAVNRLVDTALSKPHDRRVLLGPAIPREGELSVQYDAPELREQEELLVVVVERGLSQRVTAGENRGKTLHHENVVRAVARTQQETGAVQLVLPEALDPDRSSVIALRQHRRTGAITAAASRAISTAPATVSGRIETASGAPAGGKPVLMCSDFICIPGESDEGGRFSVGGVPAGEYRIVVGRPSGAPTDAQGQRQVSVAPGELLQLPEPLIAGDSRRER